MALPDYISRTLRKRIDEGNLRELTVNNDLADFCSNDYLGIATNNLLPLSESNSGSTGSRLISGNTDLALEVENYLASTFGYESALIFNSGYDANVGFFSSVAHRSDTIIYDELIHTSVKDGCRLGNAKYISFKHNSLLDLEEKIKRAEGNVFVVVESIYSMDGDRAPLKEITHLVNSHNAYLVVDEAHGLGVTEKRLGYVYELGLQENVFATLITFGKAAGCHGAAILCSKEVRSFLINFARSFIYTTALPSSSIKHIRESVELIKKDNILHKTLYEKIRLFKESLSDDLNDSLIMCEGPIQCLIVPGNKRVKQIAGSVKSKGLDVRPIMSPTVAQGRERLRICIHAFNKDEDIVQLALLLNTEILTPVC